MSSMSGHKGHLDIEDVKERFSGKMLIYTLLVFSLVFTFFVASYDINLYFYASTFIVSYLKAPTLFIGISVSAFTLGVIIFATVGGIAFNRISIKLIILLSLIFATSGSVLTGFVENVPELFLLRFLVGMGTGMLQGTVMGFMGTAYPEKRGFLLSLTGIAFSIGLLFGPSSESFIAPLYLESFLIAGVIGVASILLVLAFMPNVYSGRGEKRRLSRKGLFNRNTTLVFTGIFFYGIGFFGFIGYFSHFLINYLHMSQFISAITASMLGIGGIIFTLPFGYASDRIGRKNVLLLLYGLLAVTSFIIFGVYMNSVALIVISFIFGASYNGLIIVIAASAQDYADKGSVGAASGLVFTFYYAGGIIGGTFFGVMLSFVNFRLTGVISVTTFMIIGFLTSAFLTRNEKIHGVTVSPEEA